MSSHGPQFDQFRVNSGSPHGGAKFDEDFTQQAVSDAHGKLFDQFAQKPGVDRYGDHWDDFPWKDMPVTHGQRFDEDFTAPTAHSGPHGTWHDVFRGGAVRYIAEGRDYEGVVLNTGEDSMMVQSRDGAQHEVLLGQVMAYCDAATLQGNPHVEQFIDRAEPSPFDVEIEGEYLDAQGSIPIPGPQGERPSGESSRAMGGGRSGVEATEGNVTEHVTGKTSERLLDVVKVDSSETATQEQDVEGDGANWCPKCQHACRQVTEDGKCPTCGTPVGKAKAEKHAWMEPLDVLKTPNPGVYVGGHQIQGPGSNDKTPTEGKPSGMKDCPGCKKRTFHHEGKCTSCGHTAKQEGQA